MMTMKKVGGIWFLKLGRFGFNFYISQRKTATKEVDPQMGLSF
jgi:hypothetical protein